MILIKAKILRTSVQDKVYEGNTTRHYLFHCQKTDLDNSMIPVVLSTKDLDASKLLESHLSDDQFHLIPIENARVNQFSMNGAVSYIIDSNLVLHPKFHDLDSLIL